MKVSYATLNDKDSGKSMMVQYLGLCVFAVEGKDSTPDQGTKVPWTVQSAPLPPPQNSIFVITVVVCKADLHVCLLI